MNPRLESEEQPASPSPACLCLFFPFLLTHSRYSLAINEAKDPFLFGILHFYFRQEQKQPLCQRAPNFQQHNLCHAVAPSASPRVIWRNGNCSAKLKDQLSQPKTLQRSKEQVTFKEIPSRRKKRQHRLSSRAYFNQMCVRRGGGRCKCLILISKYTFMSYIIINYWHGVFMEQ